MILVQDICAGMWNAGLFMTQCISIPFFDSGNGSRLSACKEDEPGNIYEAHLHYFLFIMEYCFG